MSVSTIIFVVLIVLLLAAIPIWKHSKVWGYTPSIWIVLMLAAHTYTIITAK